MASPDPITEDARDYNTAKRKFGQTEAGDNDISDVLERGSNVNNSMEGYD